MTIQLDTSGFVRGPCGTSAGRKFWSDLDPFAQGYVEALFGELVAALCEGQDEDAMTYRLAHLLGFDALAPETLARIMEDCATARRLVPSENSSDDGRNFWRVCSVAGTTPYLGDDGKIYLREAT
jgi:hypothetical protein